MSHECYLCQQPIQTVIFSEERAGVSYDSGYCSRCDLYQTVGDFPSLSPDYVELADDDIDEGHIFIQTKHKLPAFRQWKQKVHKVEDVHRSENSPEKILDIGCGVGGFLEFCDPLGLDLYGFDASEAHVRVAAKRFPNVRLCSTISEYVEEFPMLKGSVEHVTMWDVLEHIRDPDSVLSGVRDLLSDSGTLFVSVPNGKPNPFKVKLAKIRGTAPGLIPWEHVFYYTRKSLREMLVRNGFNSIKVFGVACYPREHGGVSEIGRQISHVVAKNTPFALQIGAIARK